mgnify:FL=1
MFWNIVLFIGAMALSYALRPKPKVTHARPAGASEFEVPTAQEGREVPVLFGTRRITGPNVVWWGDLASYPIKR